MAEREGAALLLGYSGLGAVRESSILLGYCGVVYRHKSALLTCTGSAPGAE